jgi:HisJ family histidinol phosphate phosphatase
MPFSHHSHSGQYCAHAHGKLADAVEKAHALNFIAFGLTEHMPRLLDSELYPEEIEVWGGMYRTVRGPAKAYRSYSMLRQS